MAKCYNCGREIPNDEKTRLCDRCKRIILPFMKIVNASTSSAVRRLLINEKNMRANGVTDGGMDYLLRFCEAHDKKKAAEKEASLNTAIQNEAVEETPKQSVDYSEVELPEDEPVRFYKKNYGTFLISAEIILSIAAVLFCVLFAMKLISDNIMDFALLLSAAASAFAAYTSDSTRRIKKELDEIKKRFK